MALKPIIPEPHGRLSSNLLIFTNWCRQCSNCTTKNPSVPFFVRFIHPVLHSLFLSLLCHFLSRRWRWPSPSPVFLWAWYCSRCRPSSRKRSSSCSLQEFGWVCSGRLRFRSSTAVSWFVWPSDWLVSSVDAEWLQTGVWRKKTILQLRESNTESETNNQNTRRESWLKDPWPEPETRRHQN